MRINETRHKVKYHKGYNFAYLTLIEKGIRAAGIVHILDSFFTFRPAPQSLNK